MIASNLSRVYIRDLKSRKKLVEQTAVDSSSELTENNDNQPFESISGKEKAQIIQKQLLTIPEQMRLATVLVHIEDFTQKEAAEMLNCSEATISRDLTIAMNLMKSKLQHLV